MNSGNLGIQSKHYRGILFNKQLIKENINNLDSSYLHINIRSAQKHLEQLEHFLALLQI